MSGEMVKHDGGVTYYKDATDAAGLCGAIVKQTAKKIGNRQYVCVEGWQAIATAHGCVLSVDSVQEDAEGNVIAVSTCRKIKDGAVVARAEGFLGMDEEMWAKRPRYARRAMAQTRAMSRVARSAFAHVVVLIDAGLSTTPAEEVPDGGFIDVVATEPTKPSVKPVAKKEPEAKPAPAKKTGGKFATISEKQAKRLFAISKQSGVSHEALKAYIFGVCGVQHSNEIPPEHYEAICAWAEAGGQEAPVTEEADPFGEVDPNQDGR